MRHYISRAAGPRTTCNHIQNENKKLCEYCIQYIKSIKSYYLFSHIICIPNVKGKNILFRVRNALCKYGTKQAGQ